MAVCWLGKQHPRGIMRGNSGRKTVDEIDFIWVREYEKSPGYWLSLRRRPIVRVFPNKDKKKWKTTKGEIEETTGTYEGAEKNVWQQATQWVKGSASR